MRFRFAALAALALLAAPAFAQTPSALADVPLVQRYQATITPAELAGHLYVYANDYMAGRETGEPGQRFAAHYLAGQYATMGVGPKGTGAANGNYGLDPYLQPFTLDQSRTVSMTYTATRGGQTVLAGGAPAAEGASVDLVPVVGTVADGSAAPVVWVGDGTALDGVDLTGAYAVGMPGGEADQGAAMAFAQAIAARGARAVILPLAPTAAPYQRMASRLVGGSGRMGLPAAEDEPSMTLLLTGADVAQTLVGGPLADATVGPTGTMLAVDVVREEAMIETENVAAFIEGSDLADEVVVISAHLDHVGVSGEGEDTIYNGADDDGSGTITILEIAEAFQRAKDEGHGPRRSILFLHVTGEEKGLLGSEYYADREPLVPMANTVADLNIDMIGRYDPERGFETTDYVYIIGADLISQDIADWNAAVNDATGTDILLSDRFNSPDDPNQFFRRSDHWNFGKYDVPFIFYFTGTHEDYHGVDDEPEKIDYDRMARIGRLIFGTAWELANRDERPAVSGVGFN